MQRSLFTPEEPFGNVVPSDQLLNECSTAMACHPSTNTLVVNGGTMSVVSGSHSTAPSSKKNSRHVSNDISPLPKGLGMVVPTNVHPDLLQMLNTMNNSNHALFHRSLCNVLHDQDDMMERLALARRANDTMSETLYDNLHKK
jgi:hypothetical protein